jgi:hypothetical protein
MSDLPRTVRIFISSPGDVKDERESARGVIHRLRRRYAKRLDLQTLLWEDFCLSAWHRTRMGVNATGPGPMSAGRIAPAPRDFRLHASG